MFSNSVLIAIPIFNERDYVGDVLEEVRKYSEHVLVIDDGSFDGTSELLDQYAPLYKISHKANMGYGRSLIDAFGFADENDFDWVITLDCDHQHEPSYIPFFIEEINKGHADIISGSRYLKIINNGRLPPPKSRLEINKRMTALLNKNLKLHLTDSFCGFKAYRTRAMADLHLMEEGYGFPLQLWVRANRAGLRIREISVPLIYHDPTRNFGGILEDPHVRWKYYTEIVNGELHYNASQDFDGPFDP